MKKEKKVCIVGFARPTRNETPWEDDSYEFWGCNEGYVLPFPKIDRWFQIHPFISFSRKENLNDPNHFEWLQKQHDFDIYMQRKYSYIPNSIGYPIDEFEMLFGRKYFRSSFDYMIAMALAEGYTTIGVYGFDMASGSEYGYQRPSAEYWIGRAEGMGVKIELPLNPNLLRGSVYGFEDNSLGFRQSLEIRKGVIAAHHTKEKQKFDELNGATIVLGKIKNHAINEPENPFDIGVEFDKYQNEMVKQSALLNILNGAKMEVDTMLKIYDGQAGVEPFYTKEKEDAEKKES